MPQAHRGDERVAGLGYGLAAYGAWGVGPVFWKQLTHVSVVEVVLHRGVWALLTCIVLTRVFRVHRSIGEVLRDRRRRRLLLASTGLLAVNWLTFIYAIEVDRLLDVSLGYFINPFVSIVLGAVVLRERLRVVQWIAVGLVVVGIGISVFGASGLPWISGALALTFGFYGLLRKLAPTDALVATAVETLWLAGPCAVAIGWLEATGRGHFVAVDPKTTLLLVATGAVTVLPLWWFGAAARRLPLTMIGFLQYLSPTAQFVLAVAVYDEPMPAARWIAFACIWGAIAVFVVEARLRHREANDEGANSG